jgi:hypothetical protein
MIKKHSNDGHSHVTYAARSRQGGIAPYRWNNQFDARLRSLGLCSLFLGILCAILPTARADAEASAFGSAEKTPGTLIGIFYDLKQNQSREPKAKAGSIYTATVDQLISSGLDESVLAGFFRATLPLYTTRIWMPLMDAKKAPEAFGVGDIVKPSLWIAHYKGEIMAPAAGTYRFLGEADDVMVVLLSGKVILVANHPATPLPLTAWSAKETSPTVPGAKNLIAGDWFTVRDEEISDFDVVVGERPGGSFRANLYLQKKDAAPGPFRLTNEPTSGSKARTDEITPWRALP